LGWMFPNLVLGSREALPWWEIPHLRLENKIQCFQYITKIA